MNTAPSHSPAPKKSGPASPAGGPGWFGVIVITLMVSIISSAVVGFVVSGFAGKLLGTNTTSSTLSEVLGKKTLTVQEESATIDAVKKVRPAVVSVVITQDLKNFYEQYNMPFGNNEFFREFFGDNMMGPQSPSDSNGSGRQKIGGGTGFVITADGLVVTNSHVVDQTGAEYTVITNDGKQYNNAKVLARDSVLDVAVLKIEAKDLPTVELGDSNSLQLGQTVVAIGYALGELENSVTKGVVSGIGRDVTAASGSGTEQLSNMIQTDTPINLGNSGGPIVNLDGQVVGISVAAAVTSQSVGFAIPINDVKQALEEVKTTGKISRPYIGVRYQIIDAAFAKKNNLAVEYGALVVRGSGQNEVAIIPGSPADKAGIVENDIILEADGERITDQHTLSSALTGKKVGDTLTVKVLHQGNEKEASIMLTERPANN